MTLEYTYHGKIDQVRTHGATSYAAKGEAQQDAALEVSIKYDGSGGTDAFVVNASQREALYVGREIDVIFRIPGADPK